MHKPVLLQEVIEYLDPQPGEFFIDGTLGLGGHTLSILSKINPSGKFLGIDADCNSLDMAQKRIVSEFPISNFQFLKFKNANFSEISEILNQEKLGKADGFLLDLGFSSLQIEASGRGFSFLKDEPLSMTYEKDTVSVRDWLMRLTEPELARIIRTYGEERMALRIAKAIKNKIKNDGPINTTKELAEIVSFAVPRFYERGRIHPATRTFLALRIFANQELAHLEKTLKSLPEILKSGARVLIISFNSLEDRLVKNYFRDFSKTGFLEILTKKPIIAGDEELKNNPRSRSAKLRAARVL